MFEKNQGRKEGKLNIDYRDEMILKKWIPSWNQELKQGKTAVLHLIAMR